MSCLLIFVAAMIASPRNRFPKGCTKCENVHLGMSTRDVQFLVSALLLPRCMYDRLLSVFDSSETSCLHPVLVPNNISTISSGGPRISNT